jgi:hexosaminidase
MRFTPACNKVCESSAVTQDALPRYRALILEPRGDDDVSADDSLDVIEVCVVDADERLDGTTNESYTIDVPAGGTVRVQTHSVYGVVRALETLTQLVAFNETRTLHDVPLSLSDAPEFAYRALMITPCITWYSVPALERMVDGMAANKLSVLHVHWTDIASFPIQSEAFPDLAKGALSPRALYTLPQLRGLVEYARKRAVRVIPEFDLPGHGGWTYGMPQLTLDVCPSILDVTRDETCVTRPQRCVASLHRARTSHRARTGTPSSRPSCSR